MNDVSETEFNIVWDIIGNLEDSEAGHLPSDFLKCHVQGYHRHGLCSVEVSQSFFQGRVGCASTSLGVQRLRVDDSIMILFHESMQRHG